ncbi:MAG: hypothetical protein ABI776_16915 [Nocardioidaceae bacterium]
MTRSRTLRGSAVALAATLAMCACSAHPGDAARIGSDSISDGHLDDVALALCAAQSGSAQTPGQALAGRAARQGALGVLINVSLSRQYGASRGAEADQSQVSSALDVNQATIDKLPASRRTAFRDTLRDYAEGQLVLISIGRSELVKRGTAKPTQQQSIATGTTLRDAWVKKHLKVSVDPRFGRFSNGALVSRSGSLSVPVSSSAVTGAQATPSQTWVAALPANEKCS